MMSDDQGTGEDVRTGPGHGNGAGPRDWPYGFGAPADLSDTVPDGVFAWTGASVPADADWVSGADGTDGPGEAGGPGSEASTAEAEEADAKAKARPAKRKRWSFVTELAVLFTVALTIALLIKSFIVQPFFIPSGSMENTLQVGDKVLVNKLVYDFRPVGRGDIVVFDGSGSWYAVGSIKGAGGSNPLARLYDDTLGKLFHSVAGLFGTDPGQTDYIKRVIGVPGDHVRCCDRLGRITVNGVPLDEKSYLIPGAAPSTGSFNLVVPAGRLWVMGDNRLQSSDSRLHDCAYTDQASSVTCLPFDRNGTIPESMVIGRAFMIVWPPKHAQILRVPATFGQTALQRPPPGSAGSLRGALGTAGGIRVVPAPSYIPLAGGMAAAIPVTFLVRWLPRRVVRRRRARRSAQAGTGPG